MRIITCLKEVAGRDTRYRIRQDGLWIEETDLTLETNECDEYALEEALKLQEQHGGEVTLLSLGRSSAEKSMRKGLAMGAHRGILIHDEDQQARSPQAVATALAKIIEKESFDLVLAGTQSDDYSYAQTGVILAELLGLPHATIVMEVEAHPAEGRIKALREMESGWFQWVEMPLPAVLTIQAGISQVRFPSLKGIMQAKRKELRKVPIEELQINWDEIPQVDLLRLYFPEAGSQAQMLEGDTQTVVSTLIEKLKKEARAL